MIASLIGQKKINLINLSIFSIKYSKSGADIIKEIDKSPITSEISAKGELCVV
jgi:hypothetical protein